MPLDNLLILIRFFKSKVITLFGSLCNQKRKKKRKKDVLFNPNLWLLSVVQVAITGEAA
jgi:hypothetical protein